MRLLEKILSSLFYIDEELSGKTPLKIKEIIPAEYEIRIEKEGYEEIVKTITIQEGEAFVVNETLKEIVEEVEETVQEEVKEEEIATEEVVTEKIEEIVQEEVKEKKSKKKKSETEEVVEVDVSEINVIFGESFICND